MGTADINIRYEDALRDARELRMQADELRRQTANYERILDEIESQWEGSSARQYMATVTKRIRELQRIASRMDDLASAIIKTAQIYRQNELAKLRRK